MFYNVGLCPAPHFAKGSPTTEKDDQTDMRKQDKLNV